MSSKNRNFSKIVDSSILIAIGFAVAGLLSIVTRVLLGRFLEPEGYGMLSQGLAVLNFFVIFALLGTGEGVARFISYKKDRDNDISSALSICLASSIGVGFIVFFFSGDIASLLDEDALKPIIQAFALNIPAYVVLSIIIGGFRGEKRTKEKVFLQNLILPLLIILTAVPLALVYKSASLAATGYLISGWLTMFIGLLIYYKKREFKRPSLSKVKSLVRFSSPLMVAEYAGFGLIWINILLLGYLVDSSAAGLYNAALPISYGITFALTAVNYLFMPIASSSFAEDKEEDIIELYNTVVKWIIALSLPLTLVLILKADLFIELLFGSSYTAAGTALAILTLGRFVDVLMGPLGQILISIGDTRKEGLSKIAGVVVLTILSTALIPVYGVSGAALGFLFGFTTTNVLRLFFVRQYIKINPFTRKTMKPFLAGLITLPVLLLSPSNLLADIAVMTVFGALYLFIFLSMKPLNDEEIAAALEILDRFSSKPFLRSKLEMFLRKCQ